MLAVILGKALIVVGVTEYSPLQLFDLPGVLMNENISQGFN